MSKNGELAAEIVVDADNLFPQIRGRVVATDKRWAPLGVDRIALRENASAYQRGRVAVNKRKLVGIVGSKRRIVGYGRFGVNRAGS